MGKKSRVRDRRACRVARFYGLDPDGWPDVKLQRYAANLDAIRAEEILSERGGDLSPEAIRALVMSVTDSPLLADREFARAVLQQARRKNAEGS